MKTNSVIKTFLGLTFVAIGLAAFSPQASAQTTISKWTFEGVNSALSYVPGAGVSTTNFYADQGTQAGIAAITGKHSGFGTPTYSSPAGNGSARSLSANGWTNNPGDYWQIAVSTVGFTNIILTFDAVGSGTGPRDFKVMYSTDGANFTQFSTNYTILSAPSWSSGTAQTVETYTYDFSSITSLANTNSVLIRLVDISTNNAGGASGGIVLAAGSSRLDNVLVAGTIAGPPQIITQPPNTTAFYGDSVGITVIAGGDAPLAYQWYTNSTPLTPLTDGSSGFGSGIITNTTAATINFTFVDTNQTGNYRVVITNALGSITSSVVHLQVNVRTPIVTNIAYLRTLHDTNFVLTDTTNIYVIEGVVTTPVNLVSGPTEVESFFMQDTNTGTGCDVFFRGGFTFPNQGDHVRVTAPLQQFNGALEVAPINGNPAHSVVILGTTPLPAPHYFTFTNLPSASNMEEIVEGSYVVVSNVFIGLPTNASGHFVAGGNVFMTNGAAITFNANVPNNPAVDLVGNGLPGTFAKSIRGVMNQSQQSGTVLTNFYSIYLAQSADLEIGTPVTPIADSYVVVSNTTSILSVLTNDIDIGPGVPRVLTVTAVTTPSPSGSASIVDSTNISFTPAANFLGTVTFGYTATDDAGYANDGTVTVVVTNGPSTIIPTVSPRISGVSIVNGNIVITGTNAQTGATYYVLTSTNVALPLNQWKTVATNVITTNGAAGNGFSATGSNVVTPALLKQFYILSSTNSNP